MYVSQRVTIELQFEMAEKSSSENTNTPDSSPDGGRITVNQVNFVGVEYPGYIKDENHMLETLGGEEAVTRTFSNSTRRLELSFRPEDPYAHAVCADRFPTANLLLRVKRRRKKQREGTSQPEEVKYEQEILGIVGNTFKYVCKHNAPINVKPAGGRRSIGRDFDRSLWPGGRVFELSCCPGGRDI